MEYTQEFVDSLSNDPKAVIKFIVDNNFLEVRNNLANLGYKLSAINNEAAVINTVTQLYLNGYNVGNILNVNYRNTTPNYTGNVYNIGKNAGKVDWGVVGGAIAAIAPAAIGLLGVILGNSNNAPDPGPTVTGGVPTPVSEPNKINWLVIGLAGIHISALGLIVWGIAAKKKSIALSGGFLLVVALGLDAYAYTQNKNA